MLMSLSPFRQKPLIILWLSFVPTCERSRGFQNSSAEVEWLSKIVPDSQNPRYHLKFQKPFFLCAKGSLARSTQFNSNLFKEIFFGSLFLRVCRNPFHYRFIISDYRFSPGRPCSFYVWSEVFVVPVKVSMGNIYHSVPHGAYLSSCSRHRVQVTAIQASGCNYRPW